MPAATQSKPYPWYAKHKMAVNTVIACLQIDAATVLSNLDKKIRGNEYQAGSDNAKAA